MIMSQTQHEHASDNLRDIFQTGPAHAPSDNTNLCVIGRGTCGTIYASTPAKPSTVAYKIGRDRDALWNDIQLTARVNRALKNLNTWRIRELQPRVSAIKGWVADEAKEGFWAESARSFAESEDRKTAPFVFALSLIPSIHLEARQALLSRYEFTTSKATVFTNPENDFCLVRPYLGLETRNNEPLCRSDNLWNFRLTREDIRSSPFNGDMAMRLATEMATGLAIIHWKAHVDGMDIDFVLGGTDDWDEKQIEFADDFETSKPFCSPSPQDLVLSAQASELGFRLERPLRTACRMRPYVLDFDKASPISFDRPEAAIKQLVTAVTCNDPYFPDPTATKDEDKELWNAFRATYLQSAHSVSKSLRQRYGKRARAWPVWFMDQWERKAEELSQGKNGKFIQFGE